MSLKRKGSSIKSMGGDVPSLSRRNTSVLSNGHVPELKRKGSSRNSSDLSPELKRKRSSVKSVNGADASVTSLKRSSSSTGSRGSKHASLVRKASSVKLPAKRVRKPKKIFTIESSAAVKKKKGKAEQKALLYLNGEYLALKTDDAEFYLCRAQQNVYDTTNEFKIMWLDTVDNTGDVYTKEYADTTELDCIITHVKLRGIGGGKLRLAPAQIRKIQRKLAGEDSSDDDESEDEADDESEEEEEEEEEEETEEEEEEDDKPKGKRTPKKKATGRGKKSAPKTKKPPTPKKPKKGKAKNEKPKRITLTPEQRKNPNLLLVPNTKVKVWNKDPFTETNEKFPNISTNVYSKLVFRAIKMKDHKQLQNLIDDLDKVYSVHMPYSVVSAKTPIHLAIKMNDEKALHMLLKEICVQSKKRKKSRVSPAASFIETANTGRYNPRSLGVRNVRQVAMSRGSKEGINALTKDLDLYNTWLPDGDDIFKEALKPAFMYGWSKDKIMAFGKVTGIDKDECKEMMRNDIVHAVRNGQTKVAGQLIEDMLNEGNREFNHLHKEALLFDGEDMRPFREVSVRKKPWDNLQITPIHCAAVNPNVKYLSKLLSVLPEYNIMDKAQRRPIHYAAACKGPEPLKYLIQQNATIGEADQSGMTELHVACQVGRPHNVQVLLEHAFKGDNQKKKPSEESDDEDEDDEDEGDAGTLVTNKWGKGGINRPITKPTKKHSLCPIHMAVEAGNLECLRVLLKYDVDVHKPLGASKNKKTPIHLAAAHGHLEIVKLLYKHGALIDQPDKLKKTPLIHAVMNGHAHVASFLLREGANPNVSDTSGNRPLHYAAGYGWYFCLKVLLDAGADPNVTNDWKISPLGISFLKGHIGLTEILLEQSEVDINFRDDNGMTLVHLACKSPLEGGIVDQIEYLVKKQKADVTITNTEGNTPLHYVTSSSICKDDDEDKLDQEKIEKSLKIAEMLIKNGCPVDAKNEQKNTALMFAISQNNEEMAKLLLKHLGGNINTEANDDGLNILHLLATQCMDCDTSQFVNIFLKQLGKDATKKFTEMAKEVDKSGYTPLLLACQVYSKGKRKDEDEEEEEEEEEEDDDGWEDRDAEKEKKDDDSDEEEITGKWRVVRYHESGHEREEKFDKSRKQNIAKITAGTAEATGPKEDKNKAVRKFIDQLVNTFKADVNAQVQKKTSFDQVPTAEKDWYECAKEAQYTSLHYLVQMEETPVYSTNGTIQEKAPVLAILLDANPNANAVNLDGETPLITAVNSSSNSHNKVHIIQSLIDSGADVNYIAESTGKNKSSTLICAIKKDLQDVVKVLVDNHADVNLVHSDLEQTPLHLAASLKRSAASIAIVKHLLGGGAYPTLCDTDKRTPLHTAVNTNVGDANVTSEMEACLIAAGADSAAEDAFGRTPLHYAFVNSKNIEEKSAIDPIEICTTLTASLKGNGLLKKDNLGRTLLHWAAYRGAGTCCMHLIQKGIDVDIADNIGNTPIAYAALNGHESCTFMLMQKNANINVDTYEELKTDLQEAETKKQGKKNNYFPILRWAPTKKFKEARNVVPFFQVCVEKDWQGVVFVLMDMLRGAGMEYAETIEVALKTRRYNLALTLLWKVKDNKLLLRVNKEKQTLLHTLALKSKALAYQSVQTRIAEELLNKGVSVSALDKFGCHAAHYAALRHNGVLLKFFLDNDKKLDVNAKDGFGRTLGAASLWAIGDRYRFTLNATGELIKRGAKLDLMCDYPSSTFSAFIGDLPKRAGQHYLFEKQYLQSHKDQGPTMLPLHWAIVNRDFETTKYLLGNSVNKSSSDGMTCLMHAVRANDVHLVRLLLDHKYEKLTHEAEKDKMKELKKKDDEGTSGKMKKQLSGSRRHFMIRTSSRSSRTSNAMDVDDDDGDDENDDEEDEDKDDEDMDVDEDEDKDEDAEDEEGEETFDIEIENAIFPDFLPIKKTSAVKLDSTDNAGNTAVHHLVNSLEYGTFDNTKLLKILHDAGASLKMKNGRGQTPLDLALESGAEKLAKGLQTLLEIPENKWRKPHTEPAVVNYTGPIIKKPDYAADSTALLKTVKDINEDEEYKPVPSRHLPYNVEVINDGELELPFDVLLTKIDVRNRPWGLYNFYKMQVVHQKGKDMYILFTNWGRIGHDGEYQQTPFQTRDDAEKEFKKIFKAKTGNHWKDIESFENHSGKYRLVSKEDRKKGPQLSQLNIDLKASTKPSKLPEFLQSLMKYWTNKDMISRSFSSSGVDSTLLPFGRVKRETLQEAKAVLDKMLPVIEQIDKDNGTGDWNEEIYVEIEKLSTEFYHLVPQPGYEYEKLYPVRDMADLRRQMGMIHNLMEYEMLAKLLAGAQFRIKEMSPLDYVYGAMDCKIRKMDESEVEAQYILKYINSTKDVCSGYNTSIQALYQVERPGENKRLESCQLDNHRLLFHGTNSANLVSILNRGLLLSPVETSVTTGARFGEGIYFADRYSKSLGYSGRYYWDEKQTDPLFMLICEVALGKIQTHIIDPRGEDIGLKKDHDSLLFVADQVPDPSMNVALPSGCTIPIGGLVPYTLPESRWTISDSEFVIFNENQCAVRYVVQFRGYED